MRGRLALAGALLALAGCLEFPVSRPDPPRYFRPESEALQERGSGARVRPGVVLRLRRVTAAAHLRERIVWRAAHGEFGFYELRRWTERPADYVEKALARELFERQRIRRAVTGAAPSLRVEVRAFEELLEPEPSASVELWVLLLDAARGALLERTFQAREPLASRDPVEFARAAGRALDAVVAEVGSEVARVLAPE